MVSENNYDDNDNDDIHTCAHVFVGAHLCKTKASKGNLCLKDCDFLYVCLCF